MGDSQRCGGYDYLFGEADAITKKIEEYHRNHGRIDDSPVPVILREHSSESCRYRGRVDDSPEPVHEHSLGSHISPMIINQLQSQPTMSIPFHSISSEHYSSQDIYHHQCQNRLTMCNTRHQCQNQHTMYTRQRSILKGLISILISWLMRFFIPRRPRSRPILVPMPVNPFPRSTSGAFEPRLVHSSRPETRTYDFADRPNQHSTEGIVRQIQEHNVNIGEGLTERQFSQLPTIKFQPSIEDKTCMICQSDYVVGEKMTALPCTHKYHKDCIRPWFQKSRLCCICQKEVDV